MRLTTTVRLIIFILTAVITLSLVSSPPIAAAVNMPNPPAAPTPETQGQASLPNLPPLTETKDKDGDTLLSSEDKSKKIDVESLLPEGVSVKEKWFFRGYMHGYITVFQYPSKIREYTNALDYQVASNFDGPEGLGAYKIGFVMGMNDGFAAVDLVQDTLVALGIKNIPSKPIS